MEKQSVTCGIKRGTGEWAGINFSCYDGCINNCGEKQDKALMNAERARRKDLRKILLNKGFMPAEIREIDAIPRRRKEALLVFKEAMLAKGHSDTDIKVLFGFRSKMLAYYCWAKWQARRMGRLPQLMQWGFMVHNPRKANQLLKKIAKSPAKWVFFCSTHDLPPASLPVIKPYLMKILQMGKYILITSKLNEEVCKDLCEFLKGYENRIKFRVSISTFEEEKLQIYEPNSPSFAERFRALKYAHEKGFRTSVSIEPYLTRDVQDLVALVQNYSTGKIWIGKMNYCVPPELRFLYTREVMEEIYKSLKDKPWIRWKDSFQLLLQINKYGESLEEGLEEKV